MTDINSDTAQRIRMLARDMGYIPRKKQNEEGGGTVGIICPEFVSSYYAKISTILSAELLSRGLESFYALSGFEFDQEAKLLRSFQDRSFSGIICITENREISSVIKQCMSCGDIPIVQIAMNVRTGEHDNICVDEKIGIQYAVEYLLRLGHRSLAFFGDQFANERLHYFREAMKLHGIPLPEHHVLLSEQRYCECGYELMGRVLAMEDRPSAIIAEYDDVALGAMRRIREKGLRVPDDFSIIGFDDADYCRYLPVALTTVNSKVRDMCTIAVETLVKKIRNPSYRVIQSILIKPDLVIRESAKSFET